ncbi:MAG TPA: CorA family divalent cation transporter [Phenylobacterium sp.]|uniref:CorA family divalent cation transporter n=1 Tax=Phenylobacterium sp. TaxID=1871053 RepID=UPI002B48953B|nr:CorA family divalent cation transporter [Phenylobacterium sp.]HKR89945.1 CorA family divalent cation transporter [Phenylobacterium sp.]
MAGVDAWEAPASGVICSFRFSGGRGAAVRDPDLKPVRPTEDDWAWTHLRLGDVRSVAMIRHMPDLPSEALELFLSGEDRVQIVEDGGWVYGVLPDLERDLSGNPQDAGRLVFAFDAGRLITARLHPLLAIDDLRRAVQRGEPFPTPGAAIVACLGFYVDQAELLLENIGRRLAAVEDFVLAEPPNPRDTELGALRRDIARRRRELQGLRSALARAHIGRQGRRVASLSDDLADLIASVEDVDRDAGVLQERGRLLHEEIDTQINNATNRSMRALTIISTLLIPPTLVTGAFGMNVPGIPFEHSPSGFLIAGALCAAVVGAALLIIRRIGM